MSAPLIGAPAAGADTAGELLRLAEACARLGGAIVRDALASGAVTVREKARNDFVTEVDAASEQAIGAYIRDRHPDHALIGEEATSGGIRHLSDAGTSGPAAGDAPATGAQPPVRWIVDPLDGTKNFIHGYPAFAVAVAALGACGLLAAAIYDPTRDELFAAERGRGATLNGLPIRVTEVDDARRALVGTGFPFRFAELSDPYLDSFRRVTAAVSDIRRGGSASLDLAYVACGRLDGFWELALSPWDIAAGWLLIEEAGGVVTDERGGAELFERGHVVAGGEAVHATLLDIVRPAFAGRVEASGRWRV